MTEDSDSLATSGAGLCCRATQKLKPAHADQQQRVRHLHPRPCARHSVCPKYPNASRGLLQVRRCHPDCVPGPCLRPPKRILTHTRHR